MRLDMGQGATVVLSPSRTVKPVELERGEFEKAVQTLAEDVRPSAYPLERA